MQCPKCQFENPEGIKFCGECGAKLERLCPSCNSSSPPSFKFCGECGHKLDVPAEKSVKDLSFAEKLTKIQKYLPKGLTEKILSQRDRIEGERKQATVMFCDMAGFTSLSEKLGPEEAYSIMDQVYEILIHKVHDYEGTVNEMTGDGILALFGAPIALEDAPQRSIRSAYAIHREMSRFSDQIKREKSLRPIKMRIGIHTGPVVVGTLGNDLRVEFKAVGDTVNIASRVQGLALPGSTYVTENTFRLTEGLFRFEALGEKEVKGKEEPVKVYRVIAPSSRRTRFDVSAERGLTPFVGKERELELLLDGFERVKEGRGQAVSVMAEAGIGKSRLLYEFRKAVSNEDVTFLEGKCLSYSRGVSYHPMIDILKSTFDIQGGDGDFEIREKVEKGLKILRVDEASTIPYLLELLAVTDSGIDKIPMSPEARKDRIIEALKRTVLKSSEIRPLIIAIEDLHWIDISSEESLKDLLDSISGARILLIFTYRPEFVHTWGGRSYHSQVNLNRLSNRESLAIVSHLLGAENIDNSLEEFILEKTEGVPFFIEELIKSLKDLKAIERMGNTYCIAKNFQTVAIPSTIQDVIMARVDSLAEEAKEVLQTGAVIEREFNYELIQRVTGLSERQLLSHLSVLKDSELLYERGVFPQSTYIFRHALTHEVVSDSIMRRRKKKLHEEIGNAIENLYKENIDEHYGVLTEHYIAGENYDKGAEYSRLACKKAEETGSINDAIENTKKRIVCLERLPQSNDTQKKIIDARTALGLYYTQICYFNEAKKAVDPIIDLASRRGYKKRLSQIYTIIGVYDNWVEEDLPEAFKHLEEALNISQEIGDDVSLFFANLWYGNGLSWNCEFQKGLYCLEKALDINVAVNNLWGISVVKSLISYLVHYFQGKINLSFQTSDDAINIAEKSGDIFSKSMAYINHGICCYGKGFFGKATEHLLKGVDFCERINFFNWNSLAEQALGDICFEIGEYQKSKEHYSKAISLLENAAFWPSVINLNKMALARTEAVDGEKDIDLESLYEYVAANKMKSCEGMMARYISVILLNIDDKHISDAEDWVKKAIKADERNGMIWHLGRDYAFYAEMLGRKGNQAKADKTLKKAIKIFKECGADGWVEKFEKEFTTNF
jgi:class 3 adenylate cyclase/tetratricopeptide (TPR) repeat protein